MFARFAQRVRQLLVLRHRLGELPFGFEKPFFERTDTERGIGKAGPQVCDFLVERRNLSCKVGFDRHGLNVHRK